MRLASDEITIRVADAVVHLRPTLRAAFRLERRYGGFEPVVRAVADGNLTIITDVIGESAGRFSKVPELLNSLSDMPLQQGVEALIDPLINHVFALAGFDKDAKPQPSTGKPMSFAEYHQKLFGLATGWLGWSPETAWNATAAEILTAYAGKLDMVQAVFGSSKENNSGSGDPDFERDEGAWSELKLLAASGGNKAR